jgi:hypothetical protein
MTRLVKLSTIVALASIVTIARGDGTPVKCAAAKQKAAVKKIGSKLKCYQKASANGVPVDQACLTAAETKFDAAIAKADAKGGCVVTGDQATIEGASDTCVQSILTLTPVTTTLPPTCETGSTYPQCGGTCPSGKSCRPYIETSTTCGTTDCIANCRCVDDATLCGQACTETCRVDTNNQCNGGGTIQTVSCCSGNDGACDTVSGTPHCCCAASCVQPQGFIGFCDQGPVCDATHTTITCQ